MIMSEQIIQVLDHICEKFGIVIDWTSDNVIPYMTALCTKLVSYEIWTSVAWMVIMSVGFIIALMLIRKYRNSGIDVIAPIYIGSGFFCFFAIPCCIMQIMDIIKCLTFPEMFIFEYIQSVINAAH